MKPGYVIDANGHPLNVCSHCGKSDRSDYYVGTHEVPDGATIILVVDRVLCGACIERPISAPLLWTMQVPLN